MLVRICVWCCARGLSVSSRAAESCCSGLAPRHATGSLGCRVGPIVYRRRLSLSRPVDRPGAGLELKGGGEIPVEVNVGCRRDRRDPIDAYVERGAFSASETDSWAHWLRFGSRLILDQVGGRVHKKMFWFVSTLAYSLCAFCPAHPSAPIPKPEYAFDPAPEP